MLAWPLPVAMPNRTIISRTKWMIGISRANPRQMKPELAPGLNVDGGDAGIVAGMRRDAHGCAPRRPGAELAKDLIDLVHAYLKCGPAWSEMAIPNSIQIRGTPITSHIGAQFTRNRQCTHRVKKPVLIGKPAMEKAPKSSLIIHLGPNGNQMNTSRDSIFER